MRRGSGSCGCPYCRGDRVPETRLGWKSSKNRNGHSYGAHRKPTKRIKQR